MIADPCNAVMVPGLYGAQEGLLARLKATFTNISAIGSTCGYVLWCPDFHDLPVGGPLAAKTGYGNVFSWNSAEASYSPKNIDTIPYGYAVYQTDGEGSTATAIPDPAGPFQETDLVADQRTLAACLKLVYTGRMTDSSGQYAMIENLPLDALLRGGAGEGPASVDNLFQYSTNVGRFGVDALEIRSRPTANSDVFRSDDTHCVKIGVGGVGIAVSAVSETARAQQPQFFGIAWRALDASVASPMTIDMVKCVEWRPKPISGLTHAPPVTINTTSMAEKATQLLDNVMSGWATATEFASSSVTAEAIKTVFTGVNSAAKVYNGHRNPRGDPRVKYDL